METNARIGTTFDDFLQAEGILEDVTAGVVEQVVAWQINEARLERERSAADIE